MFSIKVLLKSLVIFSLLFLYSLVSLCVMLLPVGGARKRSLLAGNTSFFAGLVLIVLGVRVAFRRAQRKRGLLRPKNYLVLSNHVSYVDILVIASTMPSVFITSVELKNTFPLGLFARFGGCIFVERRSPAGLKREISEIARVLSQGTSVVLFPEGTTSNGDTVRPFKNSLLTAAISTGTGLLPVCLRYTRINGHPVGPENRDSVYYYGRTSFFRHAPRLLALRTVKVECTLLNPIAARQRRSRKDLAAQAHQVISAVYHDRDSGQRRV